MTVTDITAVKQKSDAPIRLAAYCRVSTDSEDQLQSFAAQIKHYTDYVRTHPEHTLVDVYADEGLSGTSMKKRDELNRMLRDCKRGKIDRVIVKSVSRFARNTEELLTALRMLKEHDVSVYFEEQGIDSEKLNMEMIVTFVRVGAQTNLSTMLFQSTVKELLLDVDGTVSLVLDNDQIIRRNPYAASSTAEEIRAGDPADGQSDRASTKRA